ncbi:MAG: FAD-dependent monooxygenase [Casimicrobiaceae bacterium]
MNRDSRWDVLVAGAGPTGLVLALWLTRLGVRVRIVDKTDGVATTSRALVVHARTLEFYQQLGIAEDAVARGRKFAGVQLWSHGAVRGQVVLGDIGADLSPFPYMLILPQDVHERLLVDALDAAGVAVERGTELAAFIATDDAIFATLRRRDGMEESCVTSYLAGCDGAHSTVRHGMGVGFAGDAYAHLFYVADVKAGGAVMNGDLNLALDTSDFLAVFPLPGEGNARLIGTIERGSEDEQRALRWDDVSRGVLDHLPLEIHNINWFSTYHVHHRVAARFRAGRAFLLGDAAHIHSPVGGQGMNTGIGDAVNLAWKLALVIEGRADDRLLDTYESERIAFARRLVATTDRAFTFVTRDGSIARVVREDVAPRVIPELLHAEVARRFLFKTVSQIEIEYRDSALSIGKAGRTHGGDRLPWMGINFEPLQSLQWQAHVYGEASDALVALSRELALALHVFPGSRDAGLPADTLLLVRPDGYIALADPAADPARLRSYFGARGLAL